MTIKALVKKAYQTAVDKGFYNKATSVPEKLMLIVTELGEACEAHRTGRLCRGNTWLFFKVWEDNNNSFPENLFKEEIKNTLEDELADVFIRLGDLCGYLKIDIEKHIETKMAYNETREHKHGKEY